MTTYNTYTTAVATQGEQSQYELINLDVVNSKVRFTSEELTKVKRDFRYFSADLSKVNGEAIKVVRSKLDSKILDISSNDKDKDLSVFIKKFNRNIISNNPDYLLNDNSEFFLLNYRGGFIIILDKINNVIANKRCFNKKGVLLTKVQDTLSSNGELNREGEEYKAVFIDTVIIHLERKIINEVTNTPTRSTNDKPVFQDTKQSPLASIQSELNASSVSSGESIAKRSESNVSSVSLEQSEQSIHSVESVSNTARNINTNTTSNINTTNKGSVDKKDSLDKGEVKKNITIKILKILKTLGIIRLFYEAIIRLNKNIAFIKQFIQPSKILPNLYNTIYNRIE